METITFAVKDVSNIIILLKKLYRIYKQYIHFNTILRKWSLKMLILGYTQLLIIAFVPNNGV